MRPALLAPLFAFAVISCGPHEQPMTEPDPDVLFPAPARADGFQLRAELDADPGSEIWQCHISTLPGEGLLNIGKVRSMQNVPVHHTDIGLLLKSSTSSIPPGIYDCNKLYADHPELMEEPILYGAQAQQQEIDLPEGIVAQVPAGLPMIHEVHYLNSTTKPVHVWARINAYYSTVPNPQTIDGTQLRDEHLEIPPMAEHEEWTRCTFDQDIDVLFIAMHSHKLGRYTEVHKYANGQVGDLVYRNDDWSNPLIKSFTTAPMKVHAGEGFEMKCHYQNPQSITVEYGVKTTDEMCNLTYVFTPGSSAVRCKPVESSDGFLQ
jgi:hypothetical protein